MDRKIVTYESEKPKYVLIQCVDEYDIDVLESECEHSENNCKNNGAGWR